MAKTKLKPLSPSLRERKRYVVFEVISKRPITAAKKVAQAIERQLLSLVGTIGAGKAGLIFLHDDYDPQRQRGMIRVAHTSVDALLAAMSLIDTIGDDAVLVRELGVSGIMKKARTNYLQPEG